MNGKGQVVVTGITGFLGGHCALELLKQGYAVRGTLRSAQKADAVTACLAKHGADTSALSFAELDLTEDEGWDEAFEGARFVLHVASPFPAAQPKDPDDLIIPAREGTKRALAAATKAGVERVVLTSSTASIVNGHPRDKTTFDESDWTDTDKVSPYTASKTIAERAAWAFVEETSNAPQLTSINPCFIQGPLLDDRECASTEVVRRLLKREMPGCPNMGLSIVDVRDVTRAHVDAMTHPDAPGKRFICASDFIWIQDIAKLLAEHYQGQGFRIPTRRLPNFMVRFASLFDRTLRSITPELGRHTEVSNARLVETFGWQPRSGREAIIAMADSLLENGVVPRPPHKP